MDTRVSTAERRARAVSDPNPNLMQIRHSATKRRHVTPSERLCVDESMIRWYGIGGPWMDMGLPHYVSIDRKPEDGFGVQKHCVWHNRNYTEVRSCLDC